MPEICDQIVTKTVLSYSALLGDIDLQRQGWGVEPHTRDAAQGLTRYCGHIVTVFYLSVLRVDVPNTRNHHPLADIRLIGLKREPYRVLFVIKARKLYIQRTVVLECE